MADEEEGCESPFDDDEEAAAGVLVSEAAGLSNLLEEIRRCDQVGVQRALRNGANVNGVSEDDWVYFYSNTTPLLKACGLGYDEIIWILLDAGADAWWQNSRGSSAMAEACSNGHLSTVQLLLNRDNGLLEIADNDGPTPLCFAIEMHQTDIVRFLLDRGANVHATTDEGMTPLMYASLYGEGLEILRLLLAAGVDVDVEACDNNQETALHHAAKYYRIDVMRELIVQHNANMFAVDEYGDTPFDRAYDKWTRSPAVNPLLEIYGNKLTEEHDRLALHVLLRSAVYSFEEDEDFEPPLNPLQVCVPLGKLAVDHFRTLLSTLETDMMVGNRDDSGYIPIQIACRNNAPVEVMALILEYDVFTLHIADSAGALPLHECCRGNVEYASVEFLVDEGGVGTLAARNREGALPLHVLCGSTNPPLRVVQYLIHSFPGSLAAQTNEGQYPFMIAAASESASLSVLYELVRANPTLVVPR